MAVFERWMEVLAEIEANVAALLEIETTTQQDVQHIRETIALLDDRQRLQTARLLRLERRVRLLETELPQ